MSRVLPDETIQNDRRIDTFDVVTLVDEPSPPCLFDVIAELDAERTIVPRATEAAVNFGRGENKTSPLGKRNNSVDVWGRHEYRIIKEARKAQTICPIILCFLCFFVAISYLLGV
jgi:hypothetical protein